MGGVAAHLDYEMEEMVDFVSEMAQGMYAFYTSRICLADIDMTRSVAQSKAPVHPDYRKYVSQVLSSTRLPSSTILLGLHYLGQRMTILSADGNYNHGSGQVYRMLTIALVLGSKFLDDNTFQNRSWSEVSNIPVSELNVLEVEWLMAIQWDMHINPDDPEGFQLWRQRWQTWQASKLDALSLAESLKQTHIDVRSHLDGTNMQRQRSSHQRSSPIRHQTASFVNEAINNGYKDHSQSQWATPCYEYWPLIHPQTDYSPPETPEWYAHGGFGYGHATQPSAMKVPLPLQILGPNAPQSSYHTAFAQQCYPYGHGNACGCSQCIPQYDRHSMRHSQTVAG